MQRKIDFLEASREELFLEKSASLLTELAANTLLRSAARLAVIPMQDLLALGASSRMNTPALVGEENWAWRLNPSFVTSALKKKWKEILQSAKRA